ncbi:MAG: DNA photolyase family protein [Anaerolineae bacterium]|nr:DNA photolyase family protein [Anaerolineae bacterium]
MRTTIWWVRRDLRLEDNQALSAALKGGARVVPVFVLDQALLASPYVGDKRLTFLLDGLRSLDADLRARGSSLVVRQGDPALVLPTLMAEARAEAVVAERDVSPYATRRDARVAAAVPLHLVEGLSVHPPEAVRKADGGPYSVFTPYSRAWKALPLPDAGELLPAPERLPALPDLASLPMPDAPQVPVERTYVAGEAEAERRLLAFVDDLIYGYGRGRDRMDLEATSGLSPYLRFGMISARRVVVLALAARESAPGAEAWDGAQTWLDELIWREFYISILSNYPEVRRHSFREAYRDLQWANDPDDYAAWQEGRTGYPIVDAAMRQLGATGWMHNRARMIVASFLTKDLLVDWRWGERHFMQHLIDGDPAANNGGWQWSAGTGTDAAPYFRIFSPVSQGQKHDPEGTYVRRWVPELRGVAAGAIHQPWVLPAEDQRTAGCLIGVDYPAPIVDRKMARERTLAAYAAARSGALR